MAYDCQADRILLISMNNKYSEKFYDVMSKLWIQLTHRLWKCIIFIMDSASNHHSHYTADYLAYLPNCYVLFLPPYSHDLNPIDPRFRPYTKEVLALDIIYPKQDFTDATKAWEIYYNTL